MARNPEKEYWSIDLPNKHAALMELDSFCNEQGGITRADATRMILIAWAKSRQGQNPSILPAQSTSVPVDNTARFESRSASPVAHRNNNAASVELDII